MGPQGGKTGKGLEQQGIKKSEAGRRASTTVNRTTGGGNKSGSGAAAGNSAGIDLGGQTRYKARA